MYRLLLASLLLCFLFTACDREDAMAEIPVYIHIPAFNLETDYSSEGSAHSSFTTAWIFYNDASVGVFELPCTVPILTKGDLNGTLLVYPGINMNGISATRAIYNFIEPLQVQPNFALLDTFYFDAAGDSIPDVRYASDAQVVVVEDFDGSGINMEPTQSSDTSVVTISDPSLTFDYPGEDNGNCGLLTVAQQISRVEVRSSDSYLLPRGRDVYVELTYRCNNSFIVGVQANEGVIVARSTLFVKPTEEWNKIYVNIINEVSQSNQGTSFNLLFGALLDPGVDTAKIYIDNVKLVYR